MAGKPKSENPWHVYEAFLEELVVGWQRHARRSLLRPEPIDPQRLKELKAEAMEALFRLVGSRKRDAADVSYLPIRRAPDHAAKRPVLFLAVLSNTSYVISSAPLPWLAPVEVPMPRAQKG